jgi:uncharacterized membrane protein YqjE
MLKDTIIKFLKLDGFIGSLTGYVETRVELLKVEVKEDLAKSLAKLSFFFILAFALVLFVFFMSVTLAFWIAGYVGMLGGFASVAGVYLVSALIIYLLREPINTRLEKRLLEVVNKKK